MPLDQEDMGYDDIHSIDVIQYPQEKDQHILIFAIPYSIPWTMLIFPIILFGIFVYNYT